MRRHLALVIAALLAAGAAGAKATRADPPLNPFGQRLLDAHNAERRAVGAAPLRWSPALQAHAQAYAEYLAKLGRLVHAPRSAQGTERENLVQGLPDWDAERLVQEWLGEKRHFHAGTFPDICSGDEWGCTHYSQMIWPSTTEIGCGLAQGGGYQWLVCRYSPGGNRPGVIVGRRPR